MMEIYEILGKRLVEMALLVLFVVVCLVETDFVICAGFSTVDDVPLGNITLKGTLWVMRSCPLLLQATVPYNAVHKLIIPQQNSSWYFP